ncbi:MAG: chromate efflux transporter [Pseudomonadota bacterium]
MTRLLRVFGRVGLLSFGGPAAQMALMHRVLVDEEKWLDEQDYLNALGFCMLLPGPEAMQLATWAGWRIHGTPGGLIAGLLFVLPGALVVGVLAYLYATLGNVPLVTGLFFGIKTVVLAVVLEALLKISNRILNRSLYWWIAGAAFVSIFFMGLPFPLIVVLAALAGFVSTQSEPSDQVVAENVGISFVASLKTILIWCGIWAIPFVVFGLLIPNELLISIAQFFSKLAVVTFGGAYAVLAYMTQTVVNDFGWLTTGEMMDGLGLAETTPGPLILVTEFVAYLAGHRAGGVTVAILASVVAVWVTFVPCFLWIFAGAPYISWLSHQPRLKASISAITAAVVGVILHLSLWFAMHVLFGQVEITRFGLISLWLPQLGTINFFALVFSLISALLLMGLHWSVFRVLLIAALSGAGLSALGPI